jgi:hypothetical protein
MTEITTSIAAEAFRGTSFSPEQRGERFVADVQKHLEYIAQWAGQWRTDDNTGAMDDALSYYSNGYTERARAYLAAHSRCISSFIAGPSGFPVERAKKANASADKHLMEWLEWSHKQRERLRRQFDPAAPTVISTDDEDAIAQLQAKRDRLMQLQELYKAANKVCRKAGLTDDEKAAALSDLGFDDETIYEALHPQWGKPGFESYVLTNNNANIHRIEDRIKALEHEAAHRAASPTEYEIDGVRVVESDADNRLKLFFDGKPAQAVIDNLKAHGFHWSGPQGCWMRLLNNNARYAMREVLQGE